MQTLNDQIKISEADFPKPFKNGLEFNAPVHGTWNIVHIGLQMPEAVQVYVCAKNCMRGVILTAAEMGEAERFSFVILNEEDMVAGNIDDITIEGVSDVIEKRDQAGMRPKAVQLFTVCTHHFLGTDYRRLYRILGERFPDIDFYQCYMDPIMQKKGLTPDQKLRRAMLEHFQPGWADPKTVAVLGSDFALDRDSDLYRTITENGFNLVEGKTCQSYEEYLDMSRAFLYIATYPNAKVAVERAARLMGREFLYLPPSFDSEATEDQISRLLEVLRQVNPSAEKINLEYNIEEKVKETLDKIGDTEICIDGTVHPKPLSLAYFLLDHGFHVTTVYLDAISPEEEKYFELLQKLKPDLNLSEIIHVHKRIMDQEANQTKVLAIGQKAAYFRQTPYFVNMVSGFGLWGNQGTAKMLELMSQAYDEVKDLEDIVPRKGLGCESCFI